MATARRENAKPHCTAARKQNNRMPFNISASQDARSFVEIVPNVPEEFDARSENHPPIMKITSAEPAVAITRRQFASGAVAAAVLLGARQPFSHAVPPETGGKWRAAIIGHTGQGDYGHSLDLVFADRENVEVVAVADPDAKGLAKAAERTKAIRQYADYRKLLEVEKPQLVCLAARWADQRLAIGLAALGVGAHLVCEKPFTTTLAEADRLLGTAAEAKLKIAVAHQMRLAPSAVQLKREIDGGLIGDLLEMRAWGKQDDRAGGEDMIVLGSHLLDLMRLFAGDAISCSARVLHKGCDITPADARRVKEQIGPIAGDEIMAQFAFANGVQGSFTSRKRLREAVGHWGIEFVGSKGSARLLADVFPAIHVLKAGTWSPEGRTDQWSRMKGDPGITISSEDRSFGPANRRVVDDWLEAIAKDREPACSGYNAMKSIEMIMAVYEAGLSGTRVPLPLSRREHPLGA